VKTCTINAQENIPNNIETVALSWTMEREVTGWKTTAPISVVSSFELTYTLRSLDRRCFLLCYSSASIDFDVTPQRRSILNVCYTGRFLAECAREFRWQQTCYTRRF